MSCLAVLMAVILAAVTQAVENKTCLPNAANFDLLSRLKNLSYDDIPPMAHLPVRVEVELYINGISNVKASTMDYLVDIFLSQRWTDRRLNLSLSKDGYVSLPDSLIPSIWVPDLFIPQAKQGKVHAITDRSKVVKLNPHNGTLICSQRIQALLACTMDLRYFPFDEQRCQIQMESWRYDRSFVALEWLKGSFGGDYENHDVDKKLSRSLPSLTVDTSGESTNCTDSARPDFSCLNFHVKFSRQVSYFVGDIYIPSLLMVIVTWMSFWIDRKVIQGRCAMGSLTMVAISNQINSVKTTLPPSAQIKAVDIWLWTCQFYVLAAFLEFGVVNYLSRRDKERKLKYETGEEVGNEASVRPSEDDGAIEMTEFSANQRTEERPGRIKEMVTSWWQKWRSLDSAVQVDIFSRVFFPGSFILFTMIYCIHFTQVSGYNSRIASQS